MSVKTAMSLTIVGVIVVVSSTAGGLLSMLIGNAIFRDAHHPFVDNRDAACIGALGGFIAGVASLSLQICLGWTTCLRCETESGMKYFFGVLHCLSSFLLAGPVGYAILRYAVPVAIPANFDVKRAFISSAVGSAILVGARIIRVDLCGISSWGVNPERKIQIVAYRTVGIDRYKWDGRSRTQSRTQGDRVLQASVFLIDEEVTSCAADPVAVHGQNCHLTLKTSSLFNNMHIGALHYGGGNRTAFGRTKAEMPCCARDCG
ncbi:hypothetical protein BD410DRAFT_885729 [Rickenella mellea]|uniref:Uncharacterized protein n=1 Tax=Rickenella mellea TaxID=50990 RepID=A0A4Y7PPB6_9AGAM|nr:hypothetical protein BD410DRAFT_885729 [Rickenella mellea]